MKSKCLSFLSGLCLSALFFTGCSSEDNPRIPAPDMDLQPVHFNLRFSGLSNETTRSLADGYQFSDGKSISILKAYVYNQSNGLSAAPVKVVDIDIKDVNENRGGDISILLPKGQLFDVIFFGTSIPQTDPSSKLYYNSSDRTLNVNYDLVSCNDEEMDCFFASRQNVTTESVLEEPVVLKRPYAQLNIGSMDYEAYNSTVAAIKDFGVSVDGIYNKVSLMDGQLIGDSGTYSFMPSVKPSGQSFPVENCEFMAMNYLLVNLRTLVNVSLSVNHSDASVASKIIEIPGVAVERNYQTNLYGKTLLTLYTPES